jgi:surface protein
MENFFYNCSSLKELNVFNFNTDNVVNMAYMFYGCSSLKKLCLFNFNYYKLKNFSCMFQECNSLKELYLLDFFCDRNFASFFYSSEIEIINISNLKLNNNVHDFFKYLSSLTRLNISSVEMNELTDMSYMFLNCSSLKELDLSNFNTENIKI